MNGMQQLNEIANTPAAERPRPRFTFQMPKGVGSLVEYVVLVEVEIGEEIMAAKRAGQDVVLLGFELAKESLRGVKFVDEPVMRRTSTGDGSVEVALGRIDAKARSLLMQAYQNIHSANKGEAADFLASCVVTHT